MSTPDHATLIEAVAWAIARFQQAANLVDEAAAQRLGINRTDLHLLGLLNAHGPMPAGRLGAAAELSPGATTAAIDRLERAGYVERIRAGGDRRTVLVSLTPEARAHLEDIYGPVGRTGMERLARYSDAELKLLQNFLIEGYRLQAEQAARIRGASGATDEQPED